MDGEMQKVLGSMLEGSAIRHWRKEILHWHNTQALVDLYNEALGNNASHISIRWWQRMEKDNKVPVDKKRRWVITTLLNIPPAVLALNDPSPLFPRQEQNSHLTSLPRKDVDFSDYERKLRQFWKSYYSRADTIPSDILSRIQTLQDVVLYGPKEQRDRATPLLVNYLILLGNIRRDQGYTSALTYLDKAVTLAEEKKYYELQAKALYVRGYTYLDRWSLLQKTDKTDLNSALRDLGNAQDLVTLHGLSAAIQGAVGAERGYALAYNAQDTPDRLKALATIDKARHLVSTSYFRRDPYFLDVNDEWCHIDKAEAFVALGWPKSALQEVTDKARGNYRTRRRYLSMDIVEAKAYAASGKVEMCVAYLENVLPIAQNLQSCRHLTRINNIYEDLRQNPLYQTSSDVARLGVKLLKARQPELFV